ncbi:hypothetical protein BMR1_01G02506 [Babesia microti strain RI]|uniref:Uncharacterized protein n=1 Tax=Babesia microti (strain RI) TaxID=1133968 RepID=A0A1N6LWY5_BABMR|nr:hypothetical protein BMR1_01G02506 [Babesia microti strain RI]SIO73389.1 hypothetical protein BMR1_01G02506 [Babesia microti strain RI]|eukprot:XP_021337490.1 hypothetical protein BMR1_01G02506 [Babesia microti strain RI]
MYMAQRFLSTILMIKYQEEEVSLLDYILPPGNSTDKKSRMCKTTINIKKRGYTIPSHNKSSD